MFLYRRNGPRVTVDEAHSRTRGDRPDAVLLDVRENPEWTAGHAPVAVHLPLAKPVAGAAQPAAKFLTERGAQAVDVEGGTNTWAAAGHPVVDERGNSGRTA